MQIPDESLRHATEGQLLTLLLSWYEFTHPREKALEAVALAINISPSTLAQAKVGKAYIGLVRWLVIERAFAFTLFRRWFHLQEQK